MVKSTSLRLSFATAAAVLASAAFAGPITAQPDGDVFNNIYRSSEQYLTLWGSTYISQIEGKIGSIVVDGNDFYMLQPVNNFSNQSQVYWIKGTLNADGNVVFEMPQEFYIQPASPWISGDTDKSVTGGMLKGTVNEDGEVVYEEDTENPDLIMSWKDNVLTQIVPEGYEMPQLLGLFEDGVFNGSGESGIKWSVFDENLQTPPEGIKLASYACQSSNSWSDNPTRIVSIGIDGNDFWIKGLYGYFENSWIKGTVDGDKVIIPSNQYLGIYTTEMYYYFFQGAEPTFGLNEWGEEDVILLPVDHVTLTKSGDSYTADNAMLMTFGMYTANPGMPSGSMMLDVVFAPYQEVPAVPADPYVVYMGEVTEWFDQWGRQVEFVVPSEDVDGNYINPANIYYNVFINGEKYSLTPEVYDMLTETITDIPYDFSETGVVFTNGGDAHTLTLYVRDIDTFGVQSFYTVDGVTNASSPIIENAVSSVEDESDVNYYDLQGRRVQNPSKGIFVKVTRLADGYCRTEKIANR